VLRNQFIFTVTSLPRDLPEHSWVRSSCACQSSNIGHGFADD